MTYSVEIGETEVLWGRRGSTVTCYIVDGARDNEFSEFYDALAAAVSECYCELSDAWIEKVQYVNDYGEQPRTTVEEWRVKFSMEDGVMTFTLEHVK